MRSRPLAGPGRRASLRAGAALLAVSAFLQLAGAGSAAASWGVAVPVAVEVVKAATVEESVNCNLSADWRLDGTTPVVKYSAVCKAGFTAGSLVPADPEAGVWVVFSGTRVADGSVCSYEDLVQGVQGTPTGIFGWSRRYAFGGTTSPTAPIPGATDCNVTTAAVSWSQSVHPSGPEDGSSFLLGTPGEDAQSVAGFTVNGWSWVDGSFSDPPPAPYDSWCGPNNTSRDLELRNQSGATVDVYVKAEVEAKATGVLVRTLVWGGDALTTSAAITGATVPFTSAHSSVMDMDGGTSWCPGGSADRVRRYWVEDASNGGVIYEWAWTAPPPIPPTSDPVPAPPEDPADPNPENDDGGDDDASDACDFELTDPSSWVSSLLCKVVGLLADIFRVLGNVLSAIGGLIDAILDGLVALFVPSAELFTGKLAELRDAFTSHPPGSVVTGAGDLADGFADGLAGAGEAAGPSFGTGDLADTMRLPASEDGSAGGLAMQALYGFVVVCLYGALMWRLWGMAESHFGDPGAES